MKVLYLMRNVRRDATAILLLLVSGFGCATIPGNAGPPPKEGGPGETLKRLSALMQAPKAPRPSGVPAKAIPAPSSRGKSGPGAHFNDLLTKMETSQRGPVPSPEPPPAVPSTPPPATAVALLPPPAKSEVVAQPPPPTVLPLPQEEEARTSEPTPSQASGMETAALAPAPLAAEDPSKARSVPSPGPPPAVPSTPPPASDPLPSEEERLSATKSYRIGPEDVLHVSVWENPELTIDVTVRPDGKISFPLIKEIQAADFTPMELSDVISRNLKEYIKDPRVTVIVTQTNSRKIFLVGNVLRPGSYVLRHDMTLLQALSLAGGFTTFASPRGMKLIRGAGGKQESRNINYYRMIEEAELDDYMLKPGDTIVIP